MITLENHTKTVVFRSSPAKVYKAGSLSKMTAKILFYEDGQGVDIREGDFRFTLKADYLTEEFKTANNIQDDEDLFNLLVNWQNS